MAAVHGELVAKLASRVTSSPTIVAVIALYNGAKFIERAVDSVLGQSRPPAEFIVVDDGSTDGGPALVKRFAARHPVRLIRKPNGGQSSARNLGVARSTASLVAFLDQDDFWYPDHLRELVKPFETPRTKPLGWSYSNLDMGDEDGRVVTPMFLHTRKAAHPKTTLRECLANDMFVLPSASLIAREAFVSSGGFDERLRGYEDDDLFLRIFLAGYDNVFIDQALSLWRIYGGSTTSTPFMTRSRMIYARKLLDRYGTVDGEDFARTAIAPRFMINGFGEYMRAVRRGDPEAMHASLDDIETVLLPHLSLTRRFPIRMGLPFIRSYAFSRLLFRLQLDIILKRLVG